MAYIKDIQIEQFRGIQNLKLSDFSDINVFVGDNNSGKTSVLEAMELLFIKPVLPSIKRIVNQRTILNTNSNFYTSFINLFNSDRKPLFFKISANSGSFVFEMIGEERDISGEEALRRSNQSSRQRVMSKRFYDQIPETVKIFDGEITVRNWKKEQFNRINFTSIDNIVFGTRDNRDIFFLSSFGHLRYDLLKNIVDNPGFKKLVIDILREFDESISDICYVKADDGTFIEAVITEKGTVMPFSVYGDGIKKILYILNSLMDASDSILLIDEIENGLHKKYYDSLFPVVFSLAKKFNVQLFITTHSLEAIDAILTYGNYKDESDTDDPIKVITLKKVKDENGEGNKILARNITGKYVYDNRNAFNFEVRL